MDRLRKQETLPALPKLDAYETKSPNSWNVSRTEAENWRERLRFLADCIPETRQSVKNDSNFGATRPLTQEEFQRRKLEQILTNAEDSRAVRENSVASWTREETKRNIERLQEFHEAGADSPKRNRVHSVAALASQSKLPSFEVMNAISQKEDISSQQGPHLSLETAQKTSSFSIPQAVERSGKLYDNSILCSYTSAMSAGQRNDSNSYKTSSSEENFLSNRQLPWNEFVHTKNYDCIEPLLGVVLSDEQKRFVVDNAYNTSVSSPVYEEPHPLVTLRSTEGLTQEQKQLRRILKNRWSAKMSRMKRNEQIRRLEFKANEQERVIRELLEERASLKNEIELLKRQAEKQQLDPVCGSSQ